MHFKIESARRNAAVSGVYYPSTSETRYEIGFVWGSYDICTTGAVDAGSDGDADRYGGYIVARPSVSKDDKGQALWTYVVTPKGTVWRRVDVGGIPAAGRREVTQTVDNGSSISTQTTMFESPAEPVIDDFLTCPEGWQRYGILVAAREGGYRLEHMPRSSETD